MSPRLRDFGWDEGFAVALAELEDPELEPGRVLLASGAALRLATAGEERAATLSGRLRHDSPTASALPAVGDWVAFRTSPADPLRVSHVLPRRTKLSRTTAGRRTDEQVVAANVDTVIVVMGLDSDFNVRRLERLLTVVWESGARPVVLLNKIDLCGDPAAHRSRIEDVALGAPVLLASCTEGAGVERVRERIAPRETAVLVGSSGAGKSTLINRLLGEPVQKIREVRASDARGRHTTTHRELFRLPGGGLLIDNPGIREVQPWSGEESLAQAFDDVAALAEGCRFHDCAHQAEPGCSVLEAVERGDLEPSRLESYRSLQGELRYLEMRRDESAQRIQKEKWRAIHREMRRSGRHRRT